MDREFVKLKIISKTSSNLLLSVVFLTILSSCKFFDSLPIKTTLIDKNTMQKVVQKPLNDALKGTWGIDTFSYEFIEEHYAIDGNKQIQLIIKEDGTLEFQNLPDLNLIDYKSIHKVNESNVSGKWKLYQFKDDDEWHLYVSLEKNLGLNTVLKMFIKNEKLVLLNFIGDPDQGNRLLFEKK